MKNLKKFISNIKKLSSKTGVQRKKIRLLLSVALTNFTVILDILVIIIFSSFFSEVISYENEIINLIIDNKILLPFVVLVRFLCFYIEKINLITLKEDVNKNLKKFLLDNIYKSGRYSMSDSTFFITNLASHTTFFYSAFSQVLTSIIQLIVYLSFLILLSYEAVIFLLICSIFLLFPTRFFLHKARYYVDQSYKADKEIYSITQRINENLTLIKILKTKLYEFDLFDNVLNKYRYFQVSNYKFSILNSIIPNFLITFLIAILVNFLTISTYITLEFIGATLRVVQTLGILNTSINSVVNSYVHVEKFIEIFENTQNLNDYSPVYRNLQNDKAVIITDLNFRYFGSEKSIFKDLNLIIDKNKHTVITGSNGVGKSTLIGIIAGVLRPESGFVSVFSNKVAYVGATPLIIPGTLKDNICYGSKYSYSQVVLNDIINRFKLSGKEISLNTEISNKTLSSGQIQKISFMRALLSKPDILLLDESTANLDEESKKIVFEILKSLKITIINVTHNPEDFHYDENINFDKLMS